MKKIKMLSIVMTTVLISNMVYAVSLYRLNKENVLNLEDIPTSKPDLYVYQDGKKIGNFDLYSPDGAYAIDGMYGTDGIENGQVGKKVSFNIYNRNRADAVLKVFDSNNRTVATVILKGDAPESKVAAFTIDMISNPVNGIVAKYSDGLDFTDLRSPANPFSKGKGEIQVFVPEGGRIEVSKNSIEAIAVNVVKMTLQGVVGDKILGEIMGDEELMSLLVQDVVFNSLVNSITDILVTSHSQTPPDVDKIKGLFGEATKSLAKAALDYYAKKGLKNASESVIKSLMEAAGKKEAQSWMQRVGTKTLSINLTVALEFSETSAGFLDFYSKFLDLSRQMDGKSNLVLKLPSCRENAYVSYCKQQTKVSDATRWLNMLKERDMLNKNSQILMNSTSHFGVCHFGVNRYNLQQNLIQKNLIQRRNRTTIQENPYLAAGSSIVEAPADIVLNWGARPADLDSHLTGPLNANGDTFHVNFENLGSLDGNPNVLLYRDDTDHHFGGANRPEQTRINVTQPGKYNFYVHDFSNRNSTNSTALSESGAVVTLHSAGNRDLPEGGNLGRQVARFEVPTNRVGTVWHTFELDTRRNTIREIKDNNFYNAREPASVPKK